MQSKYKTETTTSLDLRVSSKERDDAVALLQAAFSDERLDESEFIERMDKAMVAKTVGDLRVVLSDLGSQPTAVSRYAPTAVAYRGRVLSSYALALWSGIETKGHFVLPQHYRIHAVMGGCLLDLREARLESAVSFINVVAVMGGVQILVPKGVRVEVHGMPFMGGVSHNSAQRDLPADAPVIHVRALAVMGGVEIKTKA